VEHHGTLWFKILTHHFPALIIGFEVINIKKLNWLCIWGLC